MSLSKSCLLNLPTQTQPPEDSFLVTFSHCLVSVFSPPLAHCSFPLSSSLCHVSSLPKLQDEEKATPLASKKPGKGRPLLGREKSADSSSTSSSASAEKQRQEARKRLLAAKKAASFRQNSATESADSIEIYVPEAQTRLWEGQWEGRICGRIKGQITVAGEGVENSSNANELTE